MSNKDLKIEELRFHLSKIKSFISVSTFLHPSNISSSNIILNLSNEKRRDDVVIIFPGSNSLEFVTSKIDLYKDCDLWLQGTSIGLPIKRDIQAFFLERMSCDPLSLAILYSLFNISTISSISRIFCSSLELRGNWNKDLLKTIRKKFNTSFYYSPCISQRVRPEIGISMMIRELIDEKNEGFFVKIFTSLITLPVLASLVGYGNIYLVGSDLDDSGYFYSDINIKNYLEFDIFSSIKVLNQFDFRSDKNYNSHKSKQRTSDSPYNIFDYLPFCFDFCKKSGSKIIIPNNQSILNRYL